MTVSQAQQALARAQEIQAAAEREGRTHLTPDEAAAIEDALAECEVLVGAHDLREQMRPRPRLTEPDQPGARGPMASAYEPTGRRANGAQLVDRHGNPIPVLAKADRFTDLARGEQAEPSDLAGFIYGAATGDWSRMSDRCRSILAQQGGAPDSAGGYLLPRPLSAEIIDLTRDASVAMTAGMRTVAMSSRTLDFAAVNDSVDPAWRAEHEPISESSIVLGRVTLEAKNLGAMVRTSEELLDDAPNASMLIRNQLAIEMAQSLDSALLLGAGGLAPVGVVNQQNVQTIQNVGTPANYSTFMQALGMLWARNVRPTALILTPNTRITLASLPTGISGDNTPLPVPRELTEFPWLTTAKLGGSDSPQSSYAILADWSAAVVGMRQELRIEVSNTGGTYESGSPPVSGDAFARVQLRVRATLRADLVLFEPFKFVVMSGITD